MLRGKRRRLLAQHPAPGGSRAAAQASRRFTGLSMSPHCHPWYLQRASQAVLATRRAALLCAFDRLHSVRGGGVAGTAPVVLLAMLTDTCTQIDIGMCRAVVRRCLDEMSHAQCQVA